MSGRLVRLFALAFCLWTTGLSAQTLPLPDNLTDLNSAQGEKFFFESGALQNYFAVADNFVTQKTQAYCGVASIVMVLNALHTPAPTTPEYQPYHTFTQDNLLDEPHRRDPAARGSRTAGHDARSTRRVAWPSSRGDRGTSR